MTLPKSGPFAGQFVCTIGERKRALLGEQFDRCNKIIGIFAAALLPPEIVAESLPLRNSAHDASKRAHLFCPCLKRVECLKVFAVPRLL